MESGPTWVVVHSGGDPAEINERSLVLRAVGVPHRVQRTAEGAMLVVPLEHADRALQELSDYETENEDWPPREELPPVPPGAVSSAIVYATVLACAFLLERGEAFDLDWWGAGMSNAALIREGEWWRAATALTLHTDLPHLAGNLIFGAVFGVLFAQLVGSGVAWGTVFLSGFLGNLANALLQVPDHRSVGASTAVFGALGCLVAYEWRRRSLLRMRPLRRWAPPILGVVLLAWFGTGGERTDVGAHFSGMFSGGLLGAAIGLTLGFRRTIEPWGPAVQLVSGVAALLAVAGSWALALSR
ncbi:MAG: rhomboid family intramembrane serine protease [Planctomycetota bacterium]